MTNMTNLLIEREKMYGSFKHNARVASTLKTDMLYLFKKTDPVLNEGFQMIFSKVSRIIVGDCYYEDSWIDINGYLQHINDYFKNLEIEYKGNYKVLYKPLDSDFYKKANYIKYMILKKVKFFCKEHNRPIIFSAKLRVIVEAVINLLINSKKLTAPMAAFNNIDEDIQLLNEGDFRFDDIYNDIFLIKEAVFFILFYIKSIKKHVF